MAIEKGDKKPSGKVLIFSNLYRPNDPVILKVAEMLKKDGNYVKLGSGATLRDMQANKYGAIVIINFIEITTKERSIKVFADENVQKKIVLLNAVGDYLSPGKGRTGSKTVKSEKIAFDIVEKTKVILSNRQKE
ncbi:MAG: hypothetical protein LHV68_08410 [Elusimicrobia bacterium]|nr:hypothetical protein [Candidatus Liberimonas magnetica]